MYIDRYRYVYIPIISFLLLIIVIISAVGRLGRRPVGGAIRPVNSGRRARPCPTK